MDEVDEQVRSVLEAMRRVLGFTSAVFARLDSDRGGLVLSFVIGERLPVFEEAFHVLGFDPSGAVFPLWAEESMLVRCYRQGRLMSTTDLLDVVRGPVPVETFEPLASTLGPRLLVCVPVAGMSGAILAVVLLDRQTTEPLNAEERDQLLVYAARLGELLEAARLGTSQAVTDQGSPVTRWLSLHLLDRTLRTGWSAGAGPSSRAVLAALEHRLKPGQFEVTLPTGGQALVNVFVVDPGGEVSWLLICEDLALRDRDVRELREQLRLRLARVRDAVVSVDQQLRVTGCNDAARDVLGYEPAEMIGVEASTFLPKGEVSAAHRKLATTLLSQGHVEQQLSLRRRDGTQFPAEVAVMLLADEMEVPAGAIATVTDMSEQRRLAKERIRLQRKLLRSERLAALGEMAARIAHEVRNPLASIGAAALSIEEDEEGGRDARSQASAIGAEVRRLDTILTDLLRFARPRPVTRRSVDLHDVVQEAVSAVRSDPLSQGVELVMLDHDATTRRVQADPDELRQVMMNILKNAVEACASAGRVTCRVTEAQGAARVEVADTGSGLSRAARRRAFEPFFSTKTRGTGLGLPISRRIIEEHGGELKLRSRRGGGTTVILEVKESDEHHGNES